MVAPVSFSCIAYWMVGLQVSGRGAACWGKPVIAQLGKLLQVPAVPLKLPATFPEG